MSRPIRYSGVEVLESVRERKQEIGYDFLKKDESRQVAALCEIIGELTDRVALLEGRVRRLRDERE